MRYVLHLGVLLAGVFVLTHSMSKSVPVAIGATGLCAVLSWVAFLWIDRASDRLAMAAIAERESLMQRLHTLDRDAAQTLALRLLDAHPELKEPIDGAAMPKSFGNSDQGVLDLAQLLTAYGGVRLEWDGGIVCVMPESLAILRSRGSSAKLSDGDRDVEIRRDGTVIERDAWTPGRAIELPSIWHWLVREIDLASVDTSSGAD